jgi:hypothetical protein
LRKAAFTHSNGSKLREFNSGNGEHSTAIEPGTAAIGRNNQIKIDYLNAPQSSSASRFTASLIFLHFFGSLFGVGCVMLIGSEPAIVSSKPCSSLRSAAPAGFRNFGFWATAGSAPRFFAAPLLLCTNKRMLFRFPDKIGAKLPAQHGGKLTV